MEALVNAVDTAAVATTVLEELKQIASIFDDMSIKTGKTMLSMSISHNFIDLIAFEADDGLKEHFHIVYDRDNATYRLY